MILTFKWKKQGTFPFKGVVDNDKDAYWNQSAGKHKAICFLMYHLQWDFHPAVGKCLSNSILNLLSICNVFMWVGWLMWLMGIFSTTLKIQCSLLFLLFLANEHLKSPSNIQFAFIEKLLILKQPWGQHSMSFRYFCSYNRGNCIVSMLWKFRAWIWLESSARGTVKLILHSRRLCVCVWNKFEITIDI